MKHFYLFILIIFITSGCSHQNLRTETYISPNKTLHLETISIDENLFMPTKVFDLKNQLIIFDNKKTDIFKVFKLPEMTHLYNYGNKGKGPDDFSYIHPGSIKQFNNNLYLLDHLRLKQLKVNDDSIQTSRLKRIKITKRPINEFRLLNDSTYITDGIKTKDQEFEIDIINLNNKKASQTIGTYPTGSEFNDDKEYPFFYKKSTVYNPETNKLALFYTYNNRMRIYSLKGELLHDVVFDKNIDNSKKGKDKIIFRAEPFSLNDRIYVLYIAKSKKEISKNINDFEPELEVWDWEGNLLDRYKLDKPIITFTISQDGKILYGTSFNNMREIYKVDLTKYNSSVENEKNTIENEKNIIENEKNTISLDNKFLYLKLPQGAVRANSTPIQDQNKVKTFRNRLNNTNRFIIDNCSLVVDIKSISTNYTEECNSIIQDLKSNSVDINIDSLTLNNKKLIRCKSSLKTRNRDGGFSYMNGISWIINGINDIIEISLTSKNDLTNISNEIEENIKNINIKKSIK